MLSFKTLHNLTPQYISDLLQPYMSNQALDLLDVPQTHYEIQGDRAFQAVTPILWKTPPLKTLPLLIHQVSYPNS